MSILSIARNALRRLFRDRSNIFFVFVLPIALVLLIGAQVGGGFTPTVGVTAPAGDPLSDQLVSELAVGDEVVTNGGLLGKITKVGESFLTVELADNVQIKLQRHAVASVMPKGTVKSA